MKVLADRKGYDNQSQRFQRQTSNKSALRPGMSGPASVKPATVPAPRTIPGQ